ncbi:MAG TPA: response regulator [Desulfobacterales bacterium]|nr:response regulator [Desulfobacterales bacterium]
MGTKTKILVVDDDEEFASNMTESLRNFEDVSADYCDMNESDVTEAIQRVSPDVVLLDVYDLPSGDLTAGLKLLRAERDHWTAQGVKLVILVTVLGRQVTLTISEAIEAVLEEGIADGHVQKPVSTIRIMKEVEALLTGYRREE